MAEKKYIDHKKFNSKLNYIIRAYDLSGVISEKIKKAIKESEAVNVVKVVRCKDCKYYRNHPNGLCYAHAEPCGTGYKGETICVEPNDYCSCGERKEVQE